MLWHAYMCVYVCVCEHGTRCFVSWRLRRLLHGNRTRSDKTWTVNIYRAIYVGPLRLKIRATTSASLYLDIPMYGVSGVTLATFYYKNVRIYIYILVYL